MSDTSGAQEMAPAHKKDERRTLSQAIARLLERVDSETAPDFAAISINARQLRDLAKIIRAQQRMIEGACVSLKDINWCGIPGPSTEIESQKAAIINIIKQLESDTMETENPMPKETL